MKPFKYLNIILLIIIIFILSSLITLSHLNESFFGTDFAFKYNQVEGINLPDLNTWSNNNLGERNMNSYNLFVNILQKLLYFVFKNSAPSIFIFLTIFLYLFSFYFLFNSLKIGLPKENKSIIFLLLPFIFISSPLLLYMVQFFTIGIIFNTSFAVFSLGFLIRFINLSQIRYIILASLFTIFIGHPPTLVYYLFSVAFLLLFHKKIKGVISFFFLTILVNLYWIIGLFIGLIFKTGIEIVNNLEYQSHVFNYYNNDLFIFKSLMFSIYPDNKLYSIVPLWVYSLLFFIAYIFVFSLLMSNKKEKEKSFMFSIMILFLILISFSLGMNYITKNIFYYFWNYFPLSQYLKSFTQILNVAYIYFIILLYLFLLKTKLKKLILTFSILIILAMLLTFIYIPSINRNLERGKIPSEYFELKKELDLDKSESRILRIPYVDYEYYGWNNNKENFFIKDFFKKSTVSLNSIEPSYNFLKDQNDLTCFLLNNNFLYIIVNKDLVKYNRVYLNIDYSYFKKIFNNLYFEVYIIRDEFKSPRIVSNNLYFKSINNQKKNLYFNALGGNQEIYFLETYDSEWKLYLIKNPSSDWCEPIAFYNNTNTTECKHTMKFFEGDEFSYLWKKPLFDDSHTMIYDYANSWTIDPQYIIDNYPPEYYKLNEDGSIDIEMVLYFKPQSYFYLGLIISLTTLILCIAYLIYDFIKAKKLKRKYKDKSEYKDE
jgi:hypothetical protein